MRNSQNAATAFILSAIFARVGGLALPIGRRNRQARKATTVRRRSTVGEEALLAGRAKQEAALVDTNLQALLAERAKQEAALAETNRQICEASSEDAGAPRTKARIEPKWDFEDYNFGFAINTALFAAFPKTNLVTVAVGSFQRARGYTSTQPMKMGCRAHHQISGSWLGAT